MKIKIVSLALLLIFISACATPEKKLAEDHVLLSKAHRSFAKRDFMGAETKYQSLLDNYSESPYRMVALMGLADSFFRQENFMEASWKYRDFYELYPVHKDAAKAHFFEGMSYYNERKTPDRDPSETKKALRQFEMLIDDPDFRASPYIQKAEQLIQACKELLGIQIFEIGRYYFNTKQYLSTINRMNEFIAKYPGMSQEDDALFMIAESYFLEDNYELADKYYKQLLQNYESSARAAAANKRLQLIAVTGDRLLKN